MADLRAPKFKTCAEGELIPSVDPEDIKRTWDEAASPFPKLVPSGPGNWPVHDATMEQVAGVMQAHLDRPVVDQTGLKGRFDFQLQWTPDETTQFTPLGAPGELPKPPREPKRNRICSRPFSSNWE